ncbi:EEF1A lysine methyltransferase 2 isoform X1 [Trachemys scripta elegans]|uniref:EEF1A lysine methyltransferase 2 isoform X1 n=1 Tax=Trachemys scripta elegans TaxID=31138 RepID=UPI0015527FEC|nr:EEF1A lysine methyltransferase 2 isoform X1 [Trachemys scripta elegans]
MSALRLRGVIPSPEFVRSFTLFWSLSALKRNITVYDWDAAYESELQIFQESGDAGEIWFGEESMIRLIRWMEKQKIPLDSSVLDIGTGNGVLLVELAKCGYTNLTGIDYSPSAIQLSQNIIEKEGLSNIKLQVKDFLTPSAELSGFQICIDKGTFDAISLNPDNAAEKRKQYVKSLCTVLKMEGFFLITSCNWTKEELLNEFREGFEILEELPTPKFCFGGRIGNSVTALVFQRKK